jgi:hypothetical protein
VYWTPAAGERGIVVADGAGRKAHRMLDVERGAAQRHADARAPATDAGAGAPGILVSTWIEELTPVPRRNAYLIVPQLTSLILDVSRREALSLIQGT